MSVPVVLGFKPNSHGFAWIAFSSPFSIHDWGIVEARGDKNKMCLAGIEKVFARIAPHTLILEAFEGEGVRISPRIARLGRAVVALARDAGMEIAIFGRNEVRACFASVGARSRDEIAAAIARSFEMLRHLLPEKRKAWNGPHRRMALFEAAAVVLTHYQLGASQLFDDLDKSIENTHHDDEE